MKNLNILGVHWIIWLLKVGVEGSWKTNIEGGLPKMEGLGWFADFKGGGGLARKSRVLFLKGEVDTPMHTMNVG